MDEKKTLNKSKHKLFVFSVDEQYYGIPIENVVEVVQIESYIKSPINKPGFLGFCDFRGKLVGTVSLIQIFAKEGATQEKPGIKNIVILQSGEFIFGVKLDKFIETCEFNFLGDAEEVPPEKRSILKLHSYRNKSLAYINHEALKCELINSFGDFSSYNTPQTLQDKADEKKEEELKLVCFTIETMKFGIPISSVVEIIEGLGVAPLFRVSQVLRGLINLRGQIIACVDISSELGLPARKLQENNKYIIVQKGDQSLALCVDCISKIIKFENCEIQRGEGVLSETSQEYITGIIERRSERILLLSIESLFLSKHLSPYVEAI